MFYQLFTTNEMTIYSEIVPIPRTKHHNILAIKCIYLCPQNQFNNPKMKYIISIEKVNVIFFFMFIDQ